MVSNWTSSSVWRITFCILENGICAKRPSNPNTGAAHMVCFGSIATIWVSWRIGVYCGAYWESSPSLYYSICSEYVFRPELVILARSSQWNHVCQNKSPLERGCRNGTVRMRVCVKHWACRHSTDSFYVVALLSWEEEPNWFWGQNL